MSDDLCGGSGVGGMDGGRDAFKKWRGIIIKIEDGNDMISAHSM